MSDIPDKVAAITKDLQNEIVKLEDLWWMIETINFLYGRLDLAAQLAQQAEQAIGEVVKVTVRAQEQ